MTHIASDSEYKEKLMEKLQEEVSEFLESSSAEEVADILEVIDAICDCMELNKEDLIKIKEKKAEERGRFKKKIILEES